MKIFTLSHCNYLSLSNNLIYTIHHNHYPLLISLSIENLFLVFYILIQYSYSSILPLFVFLYHLSDRLLNPLILGLRPSIFLFTMIFTLLLLLLWLSIIIWLVDFLIEPFIALTIIEQLSLIVGIKLLLLSELMLSFACFWCYINFRIIACILLLFYFPLVSSYSFSIPFTNPLIPLFSSLPIQSTQIFIKIGFLNYSIEGLGQPPSAGFYSIILQCKEFSYPYFSLTDRLIGPIYYFTTGLHGFHVLLGAFLFFITLFYIMFSSIYAFYFMEFPFPLFLSSHHRHFVDFIWLMVFLCFLV
jgi:cytochrome c oxidase subunit 3